MAEWEFLLCDSENAPLADISAIALDKVVSPRLSQPSQSSCRVPLTPEVLALGTGPEGLPLFSAGIRRLVATRDGQVVANDTLWRVQPEGGPDAAHVTLEFMGPMAMWDARWVQDAGGQVFDGPSSDGTDRGLDLPAGIVADPTMDVVAAQMLKEAIENTILNDGPMGVSTTGGSFSTTPSPLGSVTFSLRNLTPMRLSDLATLLVETGTCDILIEPAAAAGEVQGIVSAVNRAGADLPGVSFDWGTGQRNVAWAYPEASLDGLCTRLIYELGRRIDTNHFQNNVTVDAPGVITDPSDAQELYGVWVDYVMHPDFEGEIKNTSEQFRMFVRLWNAEQAERMVPIQMIRLVPQAGLAPEPWTDYQLGDTPRANLANLALDVDDDSFRILGWDARIDNDGPERVELQIGWSVE